MKNYIYRPIYLLFCLSLSLLTACNTHLLLHCEGEELEAAIEKNDKKSINAALKVVDIDCKEHGFLVQAAAKGRLKAVNELLRAGADPDLCDENGDTALVSAASQGELKVVKALLEAGAAPNLRDGNENTALDVATRKGHEKIVAFLKRAVPSESLPAPSSARVSVNNSGGTMTNNAMGNTVGGDLILNQGDRPQGPHTPTQGDLNLPQVNIHNENNVNNTEVPAPSEESNGCLPSFFECLKSLGCLALFAV